MLLGDLDLCLIGLLEKFLVHRLGGIEVRLQHAVLNVGLILCDRFALRPGESGLEGLLVADGKRVFAFKFVLEGFAAGLELRARAADLELCFDDRLMLRPVLQAEFLEVGFELLEFALKRADLRV